MQPSEKVRAAILPNISDIVSSIGTGCGCTPTRSTSLRLLQNMEKYGRFKYKVIPFGISDAPGFFQSQMNKIFSDLYGCGVWLYIDDILIYERDPKRHCELI